MAHKNDNKTQSDTEMGFSLVEMILYIAILSILMSTLTLTATSLLRTFAHMGAMEEVAHAGVVSLERITRELRFANSVDTGASTLDSHPGILVLNTENTAGSDTTMTLSLSGGQLILTEGGGEAIPLTHGSVTVSNLVFTHVVGTETEAVRVEMTTEKVIRTATTSKQFRTFVVLDKS